MRIVILLSAVVLATSLAGFADSPSFLYWNYDSQAMPPIVGVPPATVHQAGIWVFFETDADWTMVSIKYRDASGEHSTTSTIEDGGRAALFILGESAGGFSIEEISVADLSGFVYEKDPKPNTWYQGRELLLRGNNESESTETASDSRCARCSARPIWLT